MQTGKVLRRARDCRKALDKKRSDPVLDSKDVKNVIFGDTFDLIDK
jgi:hypothetical protein